ncbi:MAG TPA: tRNA (guanosine(37)-N1)-methyltransferase TrmD [Candidatus Cloacimonas sp.]|jgi:tRNA (guanine37-N1)-methyltransferase|nr:tRNA (guanosine(37)-N1)-methyltransferase TrmD [Candidatus Cloacimonas sp.]MDD2249490.1 tRNA (guanosine(37)-N1)-methyltransferase TrmD [Candidatus Cloacimonadota bacterium]MCK9157875.1 tRNA (guanosine(37)-N1)-methyltransferase TrmD [Candidatus Cloacimonas sp.]MCK9164386.1 tRNA (guanosine(37)-N1)-methyltransferase TrmD [Candidatus Cloacimonas sp.]MDD3733412.1 tRNA (guanosine(37)-N1)-methyltransferase TrmD [Candidatus Cloacimonadota bacterium]
MIFEVLSLFPDFFSGFLTSSIIFRAIENELLQVKLTDYRTYSKNRHHQVDDYPYGGFPGMVIQAQPIYDALQELLLEGNAPVIYFTPQGRSLNQQILQNYTSYERIILLCGHYKEIDQRVRDLCISDEISIGDYVLSGGEIPALVFMDGISRLLPGVLSDIESANSDSFSSGGLGFPCYTRPDIFMGLKVPDILLSGNHKLIKQWASEQGILLTRTRRPDLIK